MREDIRRMEGVKYAIAKRSREAYEGCKRRTGSCVSEVNENPAKADEVTHTFLERVEICAYYFVAHIIPGEQSGTASFPEWFGESGPGRRKKRKQCQLPTHSLYLTNPSVLILNGRSPFHAPEIPLSEPIQS